MQRIKNAVLILLGLICALAMSGCDADERITEMSSAAVTEAPADIGGALVWDRTTMKPAYGSLRIEYDTTVCQNITFFFEAASLELQKKVDYIETVTNFLNEIADYGGQAGEELTVYVGEDIPTICAPREMYINISDMNAFPTFFKLFLAAHAEEVNHGLAYGLTVKAYEKTGTETAERKHTDTELAVYFSDTEHLYLMDFTLPMLETGFFEEDTISYVQSAAVAFAEYCLEQQGAQTVYQACVDVSEESRLKLARMKNEWLTKLGASAAYEEYGKVAFSYNCAKKMEEYPFVIKGEAANWYFSPTDVRELGYRTFVEEYMKTAPVAEADFVQAKEVRQSYLPEEIQAVDIFTAFYREDMSFSAIYDSTPQAILAYVDWVVLKHDLLHEYIHYLTLGSDKIFKRNAGLLEAVTDEIAVLECDNNLLKMYWKEAMPEGEREVAKSIGVWNEEEDNINIEALYYYWSQNFYKGEVTNEYQSISLMTIYQPKEMNWSSLSYYAGASMTKYLMETYGRDKVFENCLEFWKLEEMCGKRFSELYDDWGAWNERMYAEVKE